MTMPENNTEPQTDNRHSDLLDAIHKSDLTRAVRVKLGALLNVPQVWATAEYAELLDVMRPEAEPMLCDGCGSTDKPVEATDDGRALACPDCLPVANAAINEDHEVSR